jgi:hypothetical protein
MCITTITTNTTHYAPSKHAHHIRRVLVTVVLADVTKPPQLVPHIVVLAGFVLLQNHLPPFFCFGNVLVDRAQVFSVQVLKGKKEDEKNTTLKIKTRA